jgi:hypothetical protein
MPRGGTKSRAEKVEETHALMAANMFLESARSTPGFAFVIFFGKMKLTL